VDLPAAWALRLRSPSGVATLGRSSVCHAPDDEQRPLSGSEGVLISACDISACDISACDISACDAGPTGRWGLGAFVPNVRAWRS
jgi:hypothetical protein